MSTPAPPTRTIVVVGATGKQGSGVIAALANANRAAKVYQPQPYRILAVTRTPEKYPDLAQVPGVEVVQADLDQPGSLESVLAKQGEGAIYGLFAALAFPGLGKPADGELAQGKLCADLALKYKVGHFIYSSSEQGGDSESGPAASHVAKMVIENHVKDLGTKGLRYTILRPSFFYENFDGVLGSISEVLLWSSVKKGTKIQMVASEDVGPVARAVFENPEEYANSTMTICGDILTPAEVNAIYKKVTGSSMTRIPMVVGKGLYNMNAHAKNLVMHMERVHELRLQDAAGYTANSDQARRAYPGLMSFESWILKYGKARGGKREKNWNSVSVSEVLRGKV